MTLDFTQEGILRKDDLFEVVFDPGADKREKSIPGQTVQCVALLLDFSRTSLFFLRAAATNDTGCVRLRYGFLVEDRSILLTQLL